MGIKYIDSKRLRRVLIGGGKWIQKHESYLNELNVYPVPDGDTGSNMSMTAQSMIDEITKNTDDKTNMEELISIVEEAVLIGARGNSGTILSQVITGFLKGIEGKKRLKVEDVALALQSAKELAYNVVDNPVEGTMLTVIRMVAETAEKEKNTATFNDFIEKLVETADYAVSITPDLLPKLKEAGVVDSGAKGLYYFFLGMRKILSEIELLTNASVQESEFDKTILNIDHNHEELKYKYCTEFIILNSDFDKETFKKQLLELGDSAVFASSSKKFKVHIHSNNPGLVIDKASNIGDLQKIKIENMKLQNETVLENEKDVAKIYVNKEEVLRKDAYIILADTKALKDEFLKLGADVVILGGQGQNPSVNDILNAINKVDDNKNIYIIPNNKNVISTANLAMEKSTKPIIVVPTRTMLEGMFLLQYPRMSMKQKEKLNKLNYSIEITRAVRETTVDGMNIEVGDYLVLINTKIKFVEKTIELATDKVINEIIDDKTLAITVVEGMNKYEHIVNKLKNLKRNFTVEPKFIDGHQENYDYYIFVENRENNMSEIAILCDSSSEITEKDMEGTNITMIPIRLTAGEVEYRAEENLSKNEFWKLLIEDKKVFKSAQPSPKEVINVYNDLFRRGYKKILAILLSSKLSGTQQVFKLAREMVNKQNEIKIYDSKTVSIQLGYMIKEAYSKSMITNDVEQICSYLDKIVDKTKLYIVVDSLEYLQRGGRITKAAQTVGDFFNMKPVISVANGSLFVEKKVLGGETAAIKYIQKNIHDIIRLHSIYLLAGTGGTVKQVELAEKILDEFKQNRKVTIKNPLIEIGSTVGTHAGPVYGILVIPKLL